MFFYWKQVCIALFFIISLTSRMTTSKTVDWIANLIRYTRHDLHAYQVVMLFDDNEKNEIPNEESIHRIISRKLLTWKISLEEATARKAENLSLNRFFHNPRDTSLFLIIRSSNDSEDLSSLYNSLEFISEISNAKSRPKCLYVVSEEVKHYFAFARFLRFCWTKQFIDVSILEYKHAKGKIQNSATMVYLNPFTNTTTKVPFHKGSFQKFKWFPEKTHDLHGFEMKVGIFHEPPVCFLTFDKNGDILNVTGEDIMLMRTVAQAMNFKIKWILSTATRFGTISCDKYLVKGLLNGIIFNEIHMIGVLGGRLASCTETFYEMSVNIRPYILALVVPITPGEYIKLSLHWKLSTLGYLTIFFLIMWCLGRLLKFDHQSWGILDILMIVLGMPTPQSPRKIAEQILFGALILSCLLHSSYIYSVFTNVGLQKKTEVELKTIKDVVESPLKPMIGHESMEELFNYSMGYSWILLNKSTVHGISYQDSLDILVKNRSSACVIKETVAQWRIQQDKDEKGNSVMKIVDERLYSGMLVFMLERRSPFLSRLNQILRRITQAGVFEVWRERSLKGRKVGPKNWQEMWSSEEIKSNLILKQLTLVLFCAHSIACLVFFCELVLFYVRKRF